MSTRSYIATTLRNRKETKNVKSDDVQYIYCHFDGYVNNGVGETLLKNYTEPGDVAKIFEHGDISSLPNDPSDIYAEAYHQEDRQTLTDSEYLLMRGLSGDIFIEYVYLWKNNKWHVSYLINQDDKDSYFGCKSYHTKFYELQKEYDKENLNES